MSEYFLADRKAEGRATQRDTEKQSTNGQQEMKATLLGDFLFSLTEPAGCDPYNSTQGKAAREAWRTRRERR
jgi:hypothetical protein